MKEKKHIHLDTMQKIALGFLGVILLGSLLLWLPISNQQPIEYTDALFTSVTAVCVTGLVTVVPAVQFTLFGKIVLLLLIQVGGLGVIACTILMLMLLKRRITVKERVMIQETYGLDTISGMVRLIIRIVRGTLIVEAAGALLYTVQFIPEYGMAKGFGYGIFHAVSAFCNAGIDILGDSSFNRYVDNPLISITTMALIVLGGLGFIVWSDVAENTQKVLREGGPYRRLFTRLRLHSQIVLVATAALIVLGGGVILLLEYRNPETLGSLGTGDKVLAALFQSVTTRTAGYTTVAQGGLKEETMLISCILMFIGGSPVGTAGGIKTTTMAVLALTCLAVIRGNKDTECFGRKISEPNIRTAFCVVSIFLTILLGGTVLVTIFEGDVGLIRILYETTSALATVGLTADLTPHLSEPSKYVIMALMYLGRIGPVTMALVLGHRHRQNDRYRELPVRKVLIG